MEQITKNTPTGMSYVFMPEDGWRIEKYDVSEYVPGEEEPTLMWVRDGAVVTMFTGETTEEFLYRTNLEIDIIGGQMPTAKRMSRAFRPYPMYAFTKTLNIVYGTTDDKAYDGAGLVRRGWLLDHIVVSDNASSRRRHEYIRHLKEGERIEFTIVSERGQDKGHAIISDTIEADFVLPDDTKSQVRFTNGFFVGVYPVHGKSTMWMDVQSLVNLNQFILPNMQGWANEYVENWWNMLRSGRSTELMAKAVSHSTMNNIQSWPLAEYVYSGGDPLWFRAMVKAMARSLVQQFISASNNIRIPVPGMQAYIMPDRVGLDAGLSVKVKKGFMLVQNGTAWVSEKDWNWIAAILGGADNDDRLWLLPFNHMGTTMVLAWRSPNQVGEYVVLKLQEGSDMPEWENYSIPTLDMELLPTRIDKRVVQYMESGITPAPQCPNQKYSIETMAQAIPLVLNNQGLLGAYCNALIAIQAMGWEPQSYPAPLESVIDATVKTGDDMSGVKAWIDAMVKNINERQIPVAQSIAQRVRANTYTESHWLDTLNQQMNTIINTIKAQAEQETLHTPAALFVGASQMLDGQPHIVTLAQTMREAWQQQVMSNEDIADSISYVEERFDAMGEDAPLVALQYLVDSFKNQRTDAMVFMKGIATHTYEALRTIGLLMEVDEDGAYPRASVVVNGTSLRLNGVWYNTLKAKVQNAPAMADVDKSIAGFFKQAIATRNWRGVEIEIRAVQDRLIAYRGDAMFGYVAKHTRVQPGTYTVKIAQASDGNLDVIVE